MFITRTKLHLQTNRKNTGIFIFRDLQNGVDYIEIWEFSRRSRSWSWNTCNGIVNCDVPAARPVLCQPPPSVADWQSPARRPSAIRQNGIPGQGVLVLRQCAHSANICNRLCFFFCFFSRHIAGVMRCHETAKLNILLSDNQADVIMSIKTWKVSTTQQERELN